MFIDACSLFLDYNIYLYISLNNTKTYKKLHPETNLHLQNTNVV